MYRANKSFSVLQAIAVTAGLAILLWSLGLPSFQFAEAASVTTYSDTLSTSEPSVAADHTITFTTPTGIANGETITIDFSDGPFGNTGSVDFTDIDVSVEGTGDLTVETSCTTQQTSAAFSGTTLTITFCSGNGASVGANGTTTIEIGQNADGAGNAQLTNPAAGSYQLPLTAGSADTGETRVAIVDTVTVTATVDTIFDFTVAGLASGQTVNGTTTSTTTTATEINYGVLAAGEPEIGAQELTVGTNAANGFTVTVVADGMLRTGGNDIDGFANGTYTASPAGWTAPLGTVGLEETYGHWGLTSDDTDYFAATDTYVSASTTPVEIYTHNGPVAAGSGDGVARVGYAVQISALQEAAEDYSAILTYIATPVF